MTLINYELTQNRYTLLLAVMAGKRKFYMQAAMRDTRSAVLKAGFVAPGPDDTLVLTPAGEAAMVAYETERV